MRVSSFNVESMFSRPVAMNQDTWEQGRPILEGYASTAALLQQDHYTDADKAAIIQGLIALGLDKGDEGPMVLLRQNHGRLLKRPPAGEMEVVANGRGEWIGWLELKTEAVNESATRNTAQVIADVHADVQAVVEVEDRTTLTRFNTDVLGPLGGEVFAHIMEIDGNDERGIDVAIMTGPQYPIRTIATHVDDRDDAELIFSRDCPEYFVETPAGTQLLVMVNHLKSKGYGPGDKSDRRRLLQATRVRQIYQERRTQGVDHIVILGDFNDTPQSAPLDPLLGQGSDLRDVSTVAGFEDGGYPGTYSTANANNKIDYILCSPAVFAAISAAGVFRTGVWTASNRWPMYPNMTRAEDAASDHAAIWADIQI